MNQYLKLEERKFEFELTERQISLGCIAGRKLIEKSVAEGVYPFNITPERILADNGVRVTDLEFILQSAMSQSKYIHPSIHIFLDIEISLTEKWENASSSKSLSEIKSSVTGQKINFGGMVTWDTIEEVERISMYAIGGVPAPSKLNYYMNKARKECSISGKLTSIKYVSSWDNTRLGHHYNHPISIEKEVINFEGLTKINGIDDNEVTDYISTCSKVVYKRLMMNYNSAGKYESAIPHMIYYI